MSLPFEIVQGFFGGRCARAAGDTSGFGTSVSGGFLLRSGAWPGVRELVPGSAVAATGVGRVLGGVRLPVLKARTGRGGALPRPPCGATERTVAGAMLPVVNGRVEPWDSRAEPAGGAAPGPERTLGNRGAPSFGSALGEICASAAETNSGSPTSFEAAGADVPKGADALFSFGRSEAQAGKDSLEDAFAVFDAPGCAAASAGLPGTPTCETEGRAGLWSELLTGLLPSPPDAGGDPPGPSRVPGLSLLAPPLVGPLVLIAD